MGKSAVEAQRPAFLPRTHRSHAVSSRLRDSFFHVWHSAHSPPHLSRHLYSATALSPVWENLSDPDASQASLLAAMSCSVLSAFRPQGSQAQEGPTMLISHLLLPLRFTNRIPWSHPDYEYILLFFKLEMYYV